MNWGVVVAAGGLEKEPLAITLGSPRKALARFADVTCLAHTLDAVREAGFERCVTVSGEDVREEVRHGKLAQEGRNAVDNARIGLEALLQDGPVDGALLLPSDTPLLAPPMLARFCGTIERRLEDRTAPRWYAAGLCPTSAFRERFPSVEVHSLHFREGPMLSGALYACSPEGLLHCLRLFERLRESRKSQLGMLWRFGPWSMARYFLRRLSIPDGERILGRTLEGSVFLDPECEPETCLDYDTEADLAAIRALVH